MASQPTAPVPQTLEDVSTGTGDEFDGRVVVYNCDCHTYQQVIELLCRAVPKMTPTRAFELAYSIDHTGSAEVYTGSLKICEEIARILGQGGLRVAVQ